MKTKWMGWGLAALAGLGLALGPSRSAQAATITDQDLARTVANWSLDEQIGSLFIARKPASADQAASDVAKYHLGGLILFGTDMAQPTASLKAQLARFQAAAAVPLLIATDQEGGTVSRLNDSPAYPTRYPSPQQAFAQGGMTAVLNTAVSQAKQLKALGINWNYAPIADVSSDPNSFIYARTLGQSVANTASYIAKVVPAIQGTGVAATLKHFPGYGSAVDTHKLFATVDRTKAQLMASELVPFKAGIAAGVDAVMVTHIVMRQIDAALPASLSPKVITGLLRQELGFSGVIITDDLAMGAIQQYDAAHGLKTPDVLALQAGNDAIMADDYAVGIPAIKAAVAAGTVKPATIRTAAVRLLKLKRKLGLLSAAKFVAPTLTLDKPQYGAKAATVTGTVRSADVQKARVTLTRSGKAIAHATPNQAGRFSLSVPLTVKAQALVVDVTLGDGTAQRLQKPLTLNARKPAATSSTASTSSAHSSASAASSTTTKPAAKAPRWPWAIAGVIALALVGGLVVWFRRPTGRHRR
ncbi:glycoside hydrolase family 3 N-terminal domain-containing protein [Lacticaseibacillus kribbianus]|uniref:glycoside hydrolase family 3 N-terminal domain-containing protein n=1 Tax=Lacticaseibacillus kribbianus TaxID=2926292 RepID=UPI001CD31810|nr:glycoside hydrolase family 3 N-terminal domain-containing protein [Lacticaseibacillus kribbianus]